MQTQFLRPIYTHLIKLIQLHLVVVDELDVVDGPLDLDWVLRLVLWRDVEALWQVPARPLKHAAAPRRPQPVLVHAATCASWYQTRKRPGSDPGRAQTRQAAPTLGRTEPVVGGTSHPHPGLCAHSPTFLPCNG